MLRIQLGFRVVGAQGKSFNQALGVESGFVFEHEINGSCQLDGDHGVGFKFVAAIFGLQTLVERPDERRIAFGNDGGFAKSPAQIRIAQFGSAQPLDLPGTCDGAFDQAAIGEEVFHRWKTGNVADLVEDGEAETVADSGDAQEQCEVAGSDLFGLFLQFVIELAEHERGQK